jgi:hypothetical protein
MGIGEKPLVIIDGKPGGDLQSISPDKILSMDVLKGEGAIKLYGTEGKDGVIVIKTKAGSSIDTMPTGTKKVERIVTVNQMRKSDGTKDTTIIRYDSVTVNVEEDRIVVNGIPLNIQEEMIIRGLQIPRIDGKEGTSRVFYFKMGDNSLAIGTKTTPTLGLSVQDTEDEKGVQVISVVANGAAAKAGILSNDRILAVDETSVKDVDGLQKAIEKSQPKRSAMFHIQRGKKDMHLEVVFPRALKKADL